MITLNFNVSNETSSKSSTNAIDVLHTAENRPSPMQIEGSISSISGNIPSPQLFFDENEKSSLQESVPQPEGLGSSLTENQIQYLLLNWI
ncbi:MAG: hypothetical protein ACI86M_002561 [Saprospiraceae bacterium]|jgi:hypothetical protein